MPFYRPIHKMLNAAKFNALNEHEKTEAILTGTFLADRLTNEHYVKLYNIGNFYVEVFFDDHSHLITHFRSFEKTTFILPYLEQIPDPYALLKIHPSNKKDQRTGGTRK